MKCLLLKAITIRRKSPPSRAAWIEMIFVVVSKSATYVAAFTGGVD